MKSVDSQVSRCVISSRGLRFNFGITDVLNILLRLHHERFFSSLVSTMRRVNLSFTPCCQLPPQDRQTDTLVNRQADRYTDRLTDWQTERQTERHTRS